MARKDIDKAHAEGAAWAEGLKIGDLYRGVLGEARHRFPDDIRRARAFFAGACGPADRWRAVVTDEYRRVVRIDWIEARRALAGVQ